MDRILEELARHTDDATRPDVDLYLASGPVLRGRVMKVQQGMATVHLGPAKDPSVSYVRVEHIVAITVLAGGRSARSLTPSKGMPVLASESVRGPKAPSHHDDILTPVNEMSFAAMQAAMATPTPPEERIAVDRAVRGSAPRRTADDASAARSAPRRPADDASAAFNAPRRSADDVSAAFDAMRLGTGSVPAPDPIAEFVASQYDVITPPDPIVPVSIELPAQPMPIEAPTYLGERPQPRAKSTPEMVPPTYLGDRPQARAKTPTPAAIPSAIAAQAPETFAMRGDTPKPKGVRTPPPSRPELMRQANTHAEMLSRASRHRVEIAIAAPLDDDARRAIGHALPMAGDVLLAMLGEPKHRAALDGVMSIELVAGDAEVSRDGARLVIRCSLVDRFTPASLRAAIEAAS